MKPDDNQPNDSANTPPDSPATPQQQAPSDALSRTPDELADEKAESEAAEATTPEKTTPTAKVSPLRRWFKKVNLYFLLFLLVVTIAAVITAVNYLNSQTEAPTPSFGSQDLSKEDLEKLANTDASVGSRAQTLTIQGNAIIDGQTLMRGDLNLAGNLQAAGSIQGASLTIAGSANLGETQINSLQVAQNAAIQGNTSLRDLSVSGSSSFSGAVNASQLTVSRLVMSGNASLEVPNHVRFSGPSPSRSINSSVLGGGGSASINGSDTSGTININTGNNPSVGCFIRVNFNQQFSNRPHVIISPVGAAAGRTQYYVDRNQAGFSVCTNNPAPANQAFGFDYFVAN